MKKILTKLVTITFLFLAGTSIVFAAAPSLNDKLDTLVPRKGENEEREEDVMEDMGLERNFNEESAAIGNLPEITPEAAITTAIKTILGASMILTIIALVGISIYYLTAQGEEENLTKAKNAILYLIVGILIMAAAYGVVTGISQFKFFDYFE